jgi:phenylpyruvate tautomerase PptA (4-oxalocrotonate tautomerase family)
VQKELNFILRETAHLLSQRSFILVLSLRRAPVILVAMIAYKCLVNGAIDAATRESVVAGLERIYAARFNVSATQMRVDFTEVTPGLWFTGGQPSRASMVLGSVPAGTSQAVRVQVMEEVCRMFSDVTGAPYHDVMVVAADPKAAA